MHSLSDIRQRGFTLIELLVVIAIISILAVVVFVALDPVTRFADSRDARRQQDVQGILTAVQQSIVDDGGVLPVDTNGGTTATDITATPTELGTCASCIDLSGSLSAYLLSMPTDPQVGSATNTGYSISVNSAGIVTISALNAENQTVSASR
ncbi:MAG: hypothetical protein COU69_03120 [Candidatus Pacebacteria bacterium CG10_big_fil_rev_8_21_14_0_10_56_10]|nr:MAG: hypothetical protein COU69_03120 [Candidatus Pacebacteria bacterium CG10_big_fil_rev_8_21_14_0_10_56_10]